MNPNNSLLNKELDATQLDNIKTHLDLLLLALESIAGIGSESALQAAKELGLESTISHRVELWRLRQSNPLRKSSGGRKKLDVEEARALVLLICHLAQQHQELLRRACILLEQMSHAPLLDDYLDKFASLYEERMEGTPSDVSQIAVKLLIDLLFYSAVNGYRRLWLALLDYSQ